MKYSTFVKYETSRKLGEGAFSVVYAATKLESKQQVAMKCLKREFSSIQTVAASREIRNHVKLQDADYTLKMLDVLYDPRTGQTAVVFEKMQCNLLDYIQRRKAEAKELNRFQLLMTKRELQLLARQLILSAWEMHSRGVIHRDIKPENILLSNHEKLLSKAVAVERSSSIGGGGGGNRTTIFECKIGDLGSSRDISDRKIELRLTPEMDDGHDLENRRPLTNYVSTRWYRSPECLLSEGQYSFGLDVWAIGSVLYEALTGHPLFPGDCETDQIEQIHRVIGKPSIGVYNSLRGNNTTFSPIPQVPVKTRSGHIAKQYSCLKEYLESHIGHDPEWHSFIHLVLRMLEYHPHDRATIQECLSHPFIQNVNTCLPVNINKSPSTATTAASSSDIYLPPSTPPTTTSSTTEVQ